MATIGSSGIAEPLAHTETLRSAEAIAVFRRIENIGALRVAGLRNSLPKPKLTMSPLQSTVVDASFSALARRLMPGLLHRRQQVLDGAARAQMHFGRYLHAGRELETAAVMLE